jgi:hypothetical protein
MKVKNIAKMIVYYAILRHCVLHLKILMQQISSSKNIP